MPSKTAYKRGWKNIQQDTKLRKKTKLALVVLAAVFLIIALGKTIQLINRYTQPLTVEKQIKSYLWDGRSNINLVVHSRQISLVGFNPVESKVTIVNIPDNTYLKVSDKFGSWKISSVYGLGQSEKPAVGNTLLVGSISLMLGLPVDGFLFYKGDSLTVDLIGNLKQNPYSALRSINDLETNLTPIELFKLYKGLSSVRFDKIEVIDLQDAGLMEEDKLADDSIVYQPDLIKLDSIAPNFYENQITQEQLTVAIYNATDYPGLAQKVARLVKNIGANVIISSNSSQKLANGTIVLKNNNLKDSFTNKKLNQLLKFGKMNFDLSRLEEFRADINILLGEDVKALF